MKKKRKNEETVVYTPPLPVDLGIMRTIVTDPMGSYTGRPAERYEDPVQDADDL